MSRTYHFMWNMKQSELSRNRITDTIISIGSQSHSPHVGSQLTIQL